MANPARLALLQLSGDVGAHGRAPLRLTAGLLLLLGGLRLAAQVPPAPEPPVYRSDLDHSAVGFSVRHFVTPVPGRFRDFSATIRYDRDDPARSSVEFRVKAASIETDNDDRDAHLRSADFFDAARYPELTFASTSVRALEATRFEVTGDLSVRGVVRRVTLPVTLLGLVRTPQGERIGFETAFSLDRKDYGITWNRVLEGAGALLGDEVKVTISVEALRSPASAAP
ncbi:MAG TPA: YceI family protein [Thermoanaerobaculia bacterium]|nr:YceI family protein [Thermoanaerobaculia bacterium]